MTRSLESQAEQVARQIAHDAALQGRLPVDPGHIARLTGIVREARQAGHDAAMRAVLDAWHLFTESIEDAAMDSFVENLANIAGPAVIGETSRKDEQR
jgi:hypothetical protein